MENKVTLRFKGHEKFILREGWLTKGLMAVKENNKVFSGGAGADVLGVGSNMVKSIRYYLQAFDLVDDSTSNGVTLNAIGELIVQYDPYIKDDFTLCLLHSRIASNICKATTWYFLFNQLEIKEFSKEDMQKYIKNEVYAKYGREIADNAIKDDIDIILNMYGKSNTNENPEDKMYCPLAELGLISKNKESYRRNPIDIKRIDSDIILYEISGLMNGDKSISIEIIGDRLEKIYDIQWVQTNDYIDILDREGIIRVDRTAGIDVVYAIDVPTSIDVILNHYRR